MGNIYVGDANNIARKVKRIYVGDANGIARKVLKGYVGDANGVAKMFYMAFDPTLPDYPGRWLSYPNHDGIHINLMTFVTRQKLLEAQDAGYTSIEFTVSISHAGGETNRLGIGVNTTSYFNSAYVEISPSVTTTQTRTITLSLSDMINSGASNFYLVLNADRTTSSSSIYVELSNPSFL